MVNMSHHNSGPQTQPKNDSAFVPLMEFPLFPLLLSAVLPSSLSLGSGCKNTLLSGSVVTLSQG